MRYYFSQREEVVPLPNLSGLQKESYIWFLREGISDILNEISPIQDYTGRGWELSFSTPRIDKPTLTLDEAYEKGQTYQSPWYIKAKLTSAAEGKSTDQEVYMGELPALTPNGTFVINGVERVVVSQLTRSEGAFFIGETDSFTGERSAGAKILPKNGAWLEFETAKNGLLTVKIDRKRKLSVTVLLRLFGLHTNEAIQSVFREEENESQHSYIESTLEKDPTSTYEEAVMEIYRKIRPGDPLIYENAKQVVEGMFFNPRRYNLGKAGRFKMNQKLGLDFPNDEQHRILQKEDLIRIIKRIIQLNRGLGEFDDIDHLGNRRVRAVGELVGLQMRYGFLQLERIAKERMSLQPRDKLCLPGLLVSPRPVNARIHSFFASGQLSQFQEQINPLAGLDHLRRLSVVGPGGLTKERASFSVRDAHFSHYGRVCPVRTPEGPNIGLITYLSLYARVNDNGFLETPYQKLEKVTVGGKERVRVTGEVIYLAAYEEEKHYITDTSATIGKDNLIVEERIPLRKEREFLIGPATLADYMDVSSQQMVGVATALIPFVAHDDINRALVGANQQTQAVPLLKPQAPRVGTGLEEDIAKSSGVMVLAKEPGIVDFVDARKVVVETKDGKRDKYELQKFVMSNQESCIHQRPIVKIGQHVKKGSVLADGPATDQGELALGTNLKIAYMFWEGFGFEDALIISERVVKDDLLSSIHISKHTVQVLETKLGPEEITRDIPNVSEESLRNLDEQGVVYIGAQIRSGDILVGKIAPKGETEVSAEERLLRAIFGEKAREVRDNSLRMPHGEYGTVINVRILDKEDNENLPSGVLKEISIFVAQVRKITVGDKLAGRHGNKGVISKVLPVEDMPHLPDGSAVDFILSPASVVSRMNVGQLLETHLGWAGEKLSKRYAIPPFEKFKPELLVEELKKAGLPVSGKTPMIDGRTGELFNQEVVVGQAYILKLQHMAEDKSHARSIGPYGLITQQPLGGKAQFGGQRFGEMEVWALEAYGAAHMLQEMLTIKSDDLVGRTRAYQAIVQGEEIPEATIPESFKLLIRELNGLGLKVDTISDPKKEIRTETAADVTDSNPASAPAAAVETKEKEIAGV